MTLSASPVGRAPIHTRAIECSSFSRDDGLWDIEGHLTDVKAYAFDNKFRGTIEPGEPLHDMWIRLTVDRDFVIQAVETQIAAGPFEICPAITPAFQKLVGTKIGAGWNRQVRERVGGVQGCTHLVDLLRPIATVAFHTVRWSDSSPKAKKSQAGKTGKKSRPRPPLNTCHAWASDGEAVRTEFPEFYTGGGVGRSD